MVLSAAASRLDAVALSFFAFRSCALDDDFLDRALHSTPSPLARSRLLTHPRLGPSDLRMSPSASSLSLLRVPTIVLSQSDSGVGVKNDVNAFGKNVSSAKASSRG
jgi:hypothetical protein